MLRCVKQPAVTYDLVGLANQGAVTVGRETDSVLRLDSPEIPFLLSRKHATLQFQPDGRLLLHDLGSTNGTYASRHGALLSKLPVDKRWELRDNDTVGFGGPDTILVGGNHVANPFIFKFYAVADAGTTGRSEGAVDLLAQVDQANPRHQHSSTSANARRNSTGAGIKDSSTRRATRSEGSFDVIEIMDDDAAVGDQGTAGAGPSSPRPNGSPSTVMKDILCTHLSCPICQDWVTAAHALSCGHMFCGLCLVTWLNQNQSCPSCRKLCAGVPVRCFQIDAAIQDLLDQGIKVMSPGTKAERSQKQRHWDNVANIVVPDWAMSLQARKRKAAEAAARNQRGFMNPGATGEAE
ncbi:hypothetical protein FOA52_000839 [Chlamydomonas sp. UWO 241]|nr:hypothetical protein FOA52_000839 [Chlamydomonas sp. UWO 241]